MDLWVCLMHGLWLFTVMWEAHFSNQSQVSGHVRSFPLFQGAGINRDAFWVLFLQTSVFPCFPVPPFPTTLFPRRFLNLPDPCASSPAPGYWRNSLHGPGQGGGIGQMKQTLWLWWAAKTTMEWITSGGVDR
ncbi:uncharacterized protein BJX67DRAFT_897 [Aspergillus lucknowensis]|uniref:Secreted protein n=1 Tax=Aspergillus lucknowensis TaxID=176173 RepID=A0ABR4M6N2_9EURO